MVTGYLKPDSGRIIFAGRDIVGLSPRQIARLGISRSFQVPQLFQTLSVRDNLLIAESIAGAQDPPAATQSVLAQFELAAYAAQLAGSLPEGIRKLLDVAMALSSRSRLLLLDEPTSGVSADEKFAIMNVVMAAARAAGVTVIFVEHDMDIVARFAGRVVAFYDGGIIGDGPPDAVLRMADVRRYVIGEEAAHAAP
jgi:branched-chain amino acid transport system ATP-binding protein